MSVCMNKRDMPSGGEGESDTESEKQYYTALNTFKTDKKQNKKSPLAPILDWFVLSLLNSALSWIVHPPRSEGIKATF